jgi:hypothetical protein
MKLRKLLQLQEIIEGKDIPLDIHEYDFKYHSSSEDKERDILDMDLIHVIRALGKQKHVTYKAYEIEGQLSRVKNYLDNIRILITGIEEEIKNG